MGQNIVSGTKSMSEDGTGNSSQSLRQYNIPEGPCWYQIGVSELKGLHKTHRYNLSPSLDYKLALYQLSDIRERVVKSTATSQLASSMLSHHTWGRRLWTQGGRIRRWGPLSRKHKGWWGSVAFFNPQRRNDWWLMKRPFVELPIIPL